MFVSSVSFSVHTPHLTNRVGEWMYGVPYMRFVWWLLQNSLIVRPVIVAVFFVLIVLGMPFRFMYCSKYLTVLSRSVVLQKLAAGHLLYRFIESKK